MEQLKLHIGCGYIKKEGYINIDIAKEVKPDLVLNLDVEKLPYEDNTVDYIHMDHVFEHFKNPLAALKEMCRVCKPDAIIWMAVPYKFEPSDIFFHKTVGFHEKSFRKFHTYTDRPYFSDIRINLVKYELTPYRHAKYFPFKRYLKWLLRGIYWEIRYTLIVKK